MALQEIPTPPPAGSSGSSRLLDRFGRHVTYVRMSVTDRCDFRCVYCMSEKMTFVPRAQVLSLEELASLARAFTELGVTKTQHFVVKPDETLRLLVEME